ncbi:MAG: hypothetical protein L6R41_001584 [Letrouitia leprolyta]|nr:MAG: hypothetical protein L6R41_001584 [Letrouitia leprolyta]
MVLPSAQKRKYEAFSKPKAPRPLKKFKKQTYYSSSSSSASADENSDFLAVDLADSASQSNGEDPNAETPGELDPPAERARPSKFKNKKNPPPSSPSAFSSSSSDSDSDSSASHASSAFDSISNPNAHSTPKPKPNSRKISKRNDPTAFANSISSILSTKLPTSNRTDPVLARSTSAHAANTEIREARLEKKARQALRAEKKALLEKGRVKDVLLGKAVGDDDLNGAEGGEEEEEGKVGRIQEEEKRLKKIAQRGVVKLFNAVRMAQVRGEEARKEAVKGGIVGAKRREERVGEMSKKGFLELVAGGGGGKGKEAKMSGEGIEEG